MTVQAFFKIHKHVSRIGMQTQAPIIEALMKPEAYDEKTGKITKVQTHISVVFLTENFVYKIKKPVNFGFLDFSTLEKRRFYCEKELILNKRLCGDMYLEVVPINRLTTIKIKGGGETVEYALKMKRMPQEKIMTQLLEQNKITRRLVDKIAKIIAAFHSQAETNSDICKFGTLAAVRTNCDENFIQTLNVVGKTISKANFRLISEKVSAFMKQNEALFEKRIAEGKVRDCHGDIHSGNIFVTDRVYIFDAIEFNERFRYCDVASDVGFLAMDLDFKGKTHLSKFLIKKYIEYSGDKDLIALLPFYKCYRAYVRGKVVGFKLADPNVGAEEKKKNLKEAKAYFKLAATYAMEL
jgi:aminoglycoside phosphotransferase family enzyme